MVLLQDDTHYTRASLQVLNCLQHPIWVFDVERLEMYWANLAGLEVWNAPSLDELLGRDFKGDLQEATKIRMMDTLNLLKKGGKKQEQFTAYPKGKTEQKIDRLVTYTIES